MAKKENDKIKIDVPNANRTIETDNFAGVSLDKEGGKMKVAHIVSGYFNNMDNMLVLLRNLEQLKNDLIEDIVNNKDNISKKDLDKMINSEELNDFMQ